MGRDIFLANSSNVWCIHHSSACFRRTEMPTAGPQISNGLPRSRAEISWEHTNDILSQNLKPWRALWPAAPAIYPQSIKGNSLIMMTGNSWPNLTPKLRSLKIWGSLKKGIPNSPLVSICFNTKSWSSMTWMVWGPSILGNHDMGHQLDTWKTI